MTVSLRLGGVTALAAQAPPPDTWMSASEQARLANLPAAPRRAQFVAGRWLARALLADAMGGAWRDWTLTASADAGPLVAGPRAATLSIAHGGDLVACAVGTAALGTDVEPCLPRKGLDALYRAVATERERGLIAMHLGNDDALAGFVHAWTLKEASIKHDGTGLFETMLGPNLRIEATSDTARANACTWQLDGHVLALRADDLRDVSIAADTPLPAPRYWRLDAAAEPISR